MIRHIIFAVSLYAAVTSWAAAAENDKDCMWKDGRWMTKLQCDALQKAEPRDDPQVQDDIRHRDRVSQEIHQTHAREEAAKKKRCGKDYMALRVGMPFDRVEQCFEALSYVTDTVSGGGTVETYSSTFYLLHFSNGVMVGYTRRVR